MSRDVTVEFVGITSAPVHGVDVSFEIDGVNVGRARRTGSPVLVSIPDAAILEVRASVSDVEVSAVLPPGYDHVTLRFPTIDPAKLVPAAGRACCADGRCKHPCIDCQVDGATIRICVP